MNKIPLFCVSGCQTGADLGGLIAAERYGIPTEGWMPKGWKTEVGPKPEWGKRFNLVETEIENYVARTYANAKLGTGTIRFAYDFSSAGEVCTANACKKFNKPMLDVDVENPIPVQEVVDWIKLHNIEILNVAGHRGSVYPSIQGFVEKYLGEVFEQLGFTKVEHG